jgi:superfamily II DNA or RNA helicase
MMPTIEVQRTPGTIALRPYQRAALTAIEAAWLRGVRRHVLALPTGTGKTVIFASLILGTPGRALVLVHRDELVTQTVEKLQMLAQGAALDLGIVKAERDAHTAAVVVASVQTLARERRLQRLATDWALVVVDECHHAVPDNSYGRILAYLRADAPDGPLVLGCTATPFRPNNDPILQTSEHPGCFEEIVYTAALPTMIAQGYLSPLVVKELILEGLDLQHVHTRHGDYVESELGEALIAANVQEHVVTSYQELALGRRAIVFCPTTGVVNAVTTRFRMAGLHAAAVVGETPLEERYAIYAGLRAGNYQAIVSCMVLTEGFDEPSVDCIILARPTKSKVLFLQALGRGLRLWPGKDDCLLIDAVQATRRHNALSLAAQLGLLAPTSPPEGDVRPGRGKELADDLETDYYARDVDLTHRTPLHWVTTPKGYYVVSLKDQMLRVRHDSDTHYRLEVRQRDARRYTTLAANLSLEYCFGIASDTANDAQILHMVREGARWRHKARSPKQDALAQKLGVRIDPAWTSGQVSDAILRVTGEWYD